MAAIFSAIELMILGYKWKDIQEAVVKKIAQGFPVILIFFSIGLLIGSWIISGTIPMLVYYGIELINPDYIYLIAFVVPIIFSLLTEPPDTCSKIVILLSTTCCGFVDFSVLYISNNVYNEACAL